MRIFLRGLSILRYILFSKHRKGYGIHSPFLYKLISEAVYRKLDLNTFNGINLLRHELKLDNSVISVKDFGAGSKRNLSNERKINKILSCSAMNKKYGELLYKLTRFFQPDIILELGTGLGISTLYLTMAVPKAKVLTIEACDKQMILAKKNFEKLNFNNIQTFNSDIIEVLDDLLNQIHGNVLVFLDANHKKEPVLIYFSKLLSKLTNDSVLIIDDIHWSESMEEVWEIIKNKNEVIVTLDFYRFGVVLFKKEMQKQNFIIRY